jgi:hypothetical protein
LFVLSDGEIDFDQAERAAAQEIIAEERRKPYSAHPYVAPGERGITVKNARQVFIARVNAVAARLRNPVIPTKASAEAGGGLSATPKPRVVPRPLSHRKITKQQVEPSPPPTNQVLIYDGNGSSPQRIADEEFHSSLQSPVTQNWRKSIERNERLARARGRV